MRDRSADGGPPGLVIFDNDGVLVDSEPLAREVLGDVLAGYGVPLGDRWWADFTGHTMAEARRIAEDRRGGPLPAAFERDYHARLLALFTARLRPTPGIPELLDALDAAGVRYAVASNGARARLLHALEVAGLRPRFAGLTFSVDDVVAGKPAPDLFRHAASIAGVPPAACVVVEDGSQGVAAARAAGMRVIGFAADRATAARLGEVDAVAATMADVGRLLGVPPGRRGTR